MFLVLCLLSHFVLYFIGLCLKKKNPLLAGEILLLSGLTDLVDGYIARRFHFCNGSSNKKKLLY